MLYREDIRVRVISNLCLRLQPVTESKEFLWNAQLPQVRQQLLSCLHQLCSIKWPGEILADVDPQIFKAAHPLHEKQWLITVPIILHVHYHLFGFVHVEGQVLVFTQCHLPCIGRLVLARCFFSFIRKLLDVIVLVGGYTVMGVDIVALSGT